MTARLIIGDVRAVLATIPDASVDLVLTSWPYLGLRSYLPAGHVDKELEIGSESTPAEFIDTLLAITADLRRVLAPHGSICTELGDTFAGSGGAGGDYGTKDPGHVGLREGQPKFGGSALSARRTRNANRQSGGLANYSDARGNPDGMRDTTFQGANSRNGSGVGWPLDKCLAQIPELYRVALAYGINPLTGEESPAGRWRVRNLVVHARPNPPVGALGDKYRPACSYWAVACTSRTRYFDLDAVRTQSDYDRPNLAGKGSRPGGTPPGQKPNGADHTVNPAGAPPLDWHRDQFDDDAWHVPTHGYPGAHFATFAPALITRFIESMCPRRVCRMCGGPSVRLTESRYIGQPDTGTRKKDTGRLNHADHPPETGWEREDVTTGWTDCGHDSWRPGLVLDPFAGSGTTLAVATGHGRDAIGIDLDARNVDLARDRVGMFLEVGDATSEAAVDVEVSEGVPRLSPGLVGGSGLSSGRDSEFLVITKLAFIHRAVEEEAEPQ